METGVKAGAGADVLAFGEVLWDIIGGDAHIGGAPFNFAAHVVKCGFSAAIVSAVGDDDLGRRALDAVNGLQVDSAFVRVHPSLPTGTVNVTLENGIPSYEISMPVAWDEIGFPSVEAPPAPRALYFGTLATRSSVSSAALDTMLSAYPSALTFFDVNLRQKFWSVQSVRERLVFADILKVNDEEMRTLGFCPDRLFEEFPRLKTLIETRGAEGCAVWERDGEAFTCPAVDDGPVVDTVGAGDSFSAAFLSAVLEGRTLAEAAHAGSVRAGKVASRAGAVPDGV
jgi:fructokinase